MRQIIIFSEQELQHLMTVGNEVECRMRDGQTLVFMSEETYREEMRLKNNPS